MLTGKAAAADALQQSLVRLRQATEVGMEKELLELARAALERTRKETAALLEKGRTDEARRLLDFRSLDYGVVEAAEIIRQHEALKREVERQARLTAAVDRVITAWRNNRREAFGDLIDPEVREFIKKSNPVGFQMVTRAVELLLRAVRPTSWRIERMTVSPGGEAVVVVEWTDEHGKKQFSNFDFVERGRDWYLRIQPKKGIRRPGPRRGERRESRSPKR